VSGESVGVGESGVRSGTMSEAAVKEKAGDRKSVV